MRTLEDMQFAGENACVTTGKSPVCLGGAGFSLPTPARGRFSLQTASPRPQAHHRLSQMLQHRDVHAGLRNLAIDGGISHGGRNTTQQFETFALSSVAGQIAFQSRCRGQLLFQLFQVAGLPRFQNRSGTTGRVCEHSLHHLRPLPYSSAARPFFRPFVGNLMIRLTRLNRTPVVVNSDLIEHIETTPDTIISMTNGQKLTVRETAEEVVERVLEFRRLIQGPPTVQHVQES